jgi:mevalonate kinase
LNDIISHGDSPVCGLIGGKYCGSGHGGYIALVFDTSQNRDRFVSDNTDAIAVEPFIKQQ